MAPSGAGVRGPGRRRLAEGPALDRQRLIEALVRLASSEGVAALNMRRVASELGVSPRLLYHFVNDKEQMLDLLGDAILDRDRPDLSSPDWAVRLRAIAAMVRRAFSGYPGLPAAILARSLTRVGSVHAIRLREEIFRALAQAGLSQQQADQAYVTFCALVLGGMVIVEQADTDGGRDLLIPRAAVERSLEAGLELLLFGIGRAAKAA
jgi:AcrR family transcriptional regulator